MTKRALVPHSECYEKVYLWWYELQQILKVVMIRTKYMLLLENPPPRMVSEVDLWNCYCTQSRSITESHASSTCYYKEGPFVS